MERKKFIKNMALGALSFSLLESCAQTAFTQTCKETPEGEEGPFPTPSPANYTSQNIVADRAGTPLKIRINLKKISTINMRHWPQRASIYGIVTAKAIILNMAAKVLRRLTG